MVKSLITNIENKIFKLPSIVKKKVIRSAPVRNILIKQLAKVFTSILEIHLLSLLSIIFKYSLSRLNVGYFFSNGLSWTIDIFVPVLFALKYHQPLLQFILIVFHTPLYILAKKIQFMKANDPLHVFHIKYLIMLPCFLYVALIVQFIELDQTFIQTCLLQTFLTQFIIDFWSIQHLFYYLIYCPPSKINIKESQTPNLINLNESHFSSDPNSNDPFYNVDDGVK